MAKEIKQPKQAFVQADNLDDGKLAKIAVKKAEKPKEAKEAKSVPTLKELLAEAKELDLKGYSKLNKTKLGEMISEAREKSSEKGK